MAAIGRTDACLLASQATECVRVFNTTHFPFTERLLASVKNMMEMYAYTDFQAFKESIHEIAEEVGEYALYAEKVSCVMHLSNRVMGSSLVLRLMSSLASDVLPRQ